MHSHAPIQASHRPGRLARLGALLFSAAAPALPVVAQAPAMVAHCVDVGEADCTLLEFPCGTVPVDARADTEDRVVVLEDYPNDVAGTVICDFDTQHCSKANTRKEIAFQGLSVL